MQIKDNYPKIRKRIKMFFQSEEGKITREQALTAATTLMLMATAFASSSYKGRGESAKSYIRNTRAACRGLHGSHASHASHCSHGSHASHGSHGSHASHGSHGSHASHGSHGSHASHGSHGSW